MEKIDLSKPGWGQELENLVKSQSISFDKISQLFSTQCPRDDGEVSPSIAIQFGRQCGGLKRVKRTGWISRVEQFTRVESVAEHSYRMACLCMLLPAKEFNKEKLVSMALVHDLAEAIVGDIAPSQGIDQDTKHALEHGAMKKMKGDYSEEDQGQWFDHNVNTVFEEYEKRTSPESRVIKDLDRFEMCLQALEYEEETNVNLEDFFESVRGKIQHDTVKSWFAQLERSREREKKKG